jgi:hypothetical protein
MDLSKRKGRFVAMVLPMILALITAITYRITCNGKSDPPMELWVCQTILWCLFAWTMIGLLAIFIHDLNRGEDGGIR